MELTCVDTTWMVAPSQRGSMKSLVDLATVLLQECGEQCGAPVHRDVETLRARVAHEGDSFLTITLPSFCSDFERSLDEGLVAPGSFRGFGRLRSGIPEFLQGFLRHVFNADGTLRTDARVDCIRAVRQIALLAKRILRECSLERRTKAAQEYVRCDEEVDFPSSQLARYVKYVARVLFRDADPCLRNSVVETPLIPRHGPGATQEGISGNQKWIFRSWPTRLEGAGFKYRLYGRASMLDPTPDDVQPVFLEPGDEPPVRVVFVPKTLKTPRVIAVEPVAMQYAQQALKDRLVQYLERHWCTKGHINFRDQTCNQELALLSSEFGDLATLDMKEASDRVSLAHVVEVFGFVPEFLELALASRSTRALLPDGREVQLRKFASMGSALCFPVEALIFFIGIIASRCLRAGSFPTAESVYTQSRSVYVYGDDLIVPSEQAPAIADDLEALGFKVNRRKSFWTGRFRESCGVDGYGGVEVTPVYLRRDLPRDRKDVESIVSNVATANQLHSAGYVKTAMALGKAIERVVGKLPTVPLDCERAVGEALKNRAHHGTAALGWRWYSDHRPRHSWNEDLMRGEDLHWVVVSEEQEDLLEGDPAFAKCLRLIGNPDVDPEHLSTSPRPYSLALKRRWVHAPTSRVTV